MSQPDRPGRDNAASMLAADRASRSLGIELVDSGEGRAVVRMRVTAEMVNGHAIAHGGYVFLLADTAFACACNSYGPVTVAARADITFVAPARAGDLLLAYAQERTRFGRSGIYDVSVRRVDTAGQAGEAAEDGGGEDGGGDIVAEFRGHSRTIEGRPPDG